MSKTFHEKFIDLQKRTKVTKDQYNQFGKYAYRKTEDILAEIKPLCAELGLYVRLSDKIELIGDRFYVVATAAITDGVTTEFATAYAREADNQSGMAAPQVTGSSSSYARKYALSGLLGLDDEKDADDTNTHEKPKSEPKQEYKHSGGQEFAASDKQIKLIKDLCQRKQYEPKKPIAGISAKDASALIEKLMAMADAK